MKNIVDYIRSKGKENFERRSFNEVDSLVLSQLSYLNFEGLVPCFGSEGSPVTIAEIGRKALREKLFIQSVGGGNNRKFFHALETSKRFSDIALSDYINIVEQKSERQFSAITCHLGQQTLYIAYRGTDQYLVSWKEDFNMMYKGPIPAQLDALQYLERIGERFAGKIILGGHSKGGNLAVYSAIYCAKEIRERLEAIYNHDGPGLRTEVYQEEIYRQLKHKIQKTIPQTSFVGMLLYQQEEAKIIHSDAKGLLQHDPFSWRVEGTGFKVGHKLEKDALAANAAIKKWLTETDDEKRKIFVDTIYDILAGTGVFDIYEMREKTFNKIAKMLSLAKGIDEETRALIHGMIRALLKNIMDAYRN
ncbi:MAG: DUF2974 domain-containing protein [Peptostreptococcaceae bacterium]|nr:DUF2974 domain-containing protein [Peptostreptococcaceae bacterium]